MCRDAVVMMTARVRRWLLGVVAPAMPDDTPWIAAPP
jgi:hypothetical protein